MLLYLYVFNYIFDIFYIIRRPLGRIPHLVVSNVNFHLLEIKCLLLLLLLSIGVITCSQLLFDVQNPVQNFNFRQCSDCFLKFVL